MESSNFYVDLPTETLSVSQLLAAEAHFVPVPHDWHVILTDVRKSTQALSDGKHRVVNLVAAGSIIAALNIARRAGLQIPFFFGGDGATLLAPPALADAIEAALNVHRENTARNFNLDLRVGLVALADVYHSGNRLSLAKLEITRGLEIPIALGEGLQYAERRIKSDERDPSADAAQAAPDLAGMECRWDSIRPPRSTAEVVCLLAVVRDSARQAAILSAVLAELDALYGPLSQRSPVSLGMLKLNYSPARIMTEARAKLGRFNSAYFAEHWLRTLIGTLYFKFNPEGVQYLRDLVRWSDTLMIDGRLNTVISGTAAQRAKLTEHLRAREAAGELYFGLHTCKASVMSCYVRDRRAQHIHFIDGLGGGYTQAASMLKAKLAQHG